MPRVVLVPHLRGIVTVARVMPTLAPFPQGTLAPCVRPVNPCSMDRRVCHPCKGHANPRAIRHAGPSSRTVHVPHLRGFVTVASGMPTLTRDRHPVSPCTMNPTGCHRCKGHANVRDGANLYTKRARALQGSCQRVRRGSAYMNRARARCKDYANGLTIYDGMLRYAISYKGSIKGE